MPHRLLITLALLLSLMGLSACEPSESDPGTDTVTSGDTASPDDTSTPLAPEPYTLSVEQDATSASWSVFGDANRIFVCGVLDSERTLRVYKATIDSTTGTAYCADAGAFDDVILRFTGRDVQTSGAGQVTVEGGRSVTVVEGSRSFAVDDGSAFVVDVGSPADASIAPARLYVAVANDNDDGLLITFTDDAP